MLVFKELGIFVASVDGAEVLDLCYFCPQIKDKAFLVFLLICEVFDLLLANKIRFASAIPFIHQGLPTQQYAITGHTIQLIQDDDVSRDQLMRGDGLKPYIPVVDQIILVVPYFSAQLPHLPLALLACLLALGRQPVEIILHEFRLVLVQLRTIATQFHLAALHALLGCTQALGLVDQHLGLHVEVGIEGQFLLVATDVRCVGPVGIDGVGQQDEGEDVVLLVDPQDDAVGLEDLVRSQHLLDEDVQPALHLQTHHVLAIILQQPLPACLREGYEPVLLELVQMQPQFLVSNGHEDLLLLDVDVVSVVIVEGHALSPQTHLILVYALHHGHLSTVVLVPHQKVGGVLEGADVGPEKGLSLGRPAGEQPEEAQSQQDTDVEEGLLELGGLQGQDGVDGRLGGVGVVQHLHSVGWVVELEPLHPNHYQLTHNPPDSEIQAGYARWEDALRIRQQQMDN